MAVKNFDKVSVGEMLYYISPSSQQIRGLKVVEVGILKNNPKFRAFKAIRNLQDKSEAITEEAIIKAHKDEGTNVTRVIILPGEANYATISTKGGLPTFISTDKTVLEKFMEGKTQL